MFHGIDPAPQFPGGQQFTPPPSAESPQRPADPRLDALQLLDRVEAFEQVAGHAGFDFDDFVTMVYSARRAVDGDAFTDETDANSGAFGTPGEELAVRSLAGLMEEADVRSVFRWFHARKRLRAVLDLVDRQAEHHQCGARPQSAKSMGAA
jgi:hypothetical protein